MDHTVGRNRLEAHGAFSVMRNRRVEIGAPARSHRRFVARSSRTRGNPDLAHGNRADCNNLEYTIQPKVPGICTAQADRFSRLGRQDAMSSLV